MKKTLLYLLTLCLFIVNGYSQSGKSKNVYEEIPYEVIGGWPVINVVIDGSTYKFVIDTGAPGINISQRVVEKASLKTKQRTKKITDSQGVQDNLRLAAIKDMKVGGINFSTSKAAVGISIFKCYDGLDGIIGGAFLKKYAIKFDDRAKVLTITSNPFLLVAKHQKWSRMNVIAGKPIFYWYDGDERKMAYNVRQRVKQYHTPYITLIMVRVTINGMILIY
ncbi:MAG: retroviral-like aspartic protease family protein [Prevotellaceae bacterium]|jgi:predicted aspartyl protease|nr:retroviral-like aspartic protease family protein [Prevotellaceae bacterium]